jgi:hypothetical protein
MKMANGGPETPVIMVIQKCFNCPSILPNNPNIENPSKSKFDYFSKYEAI